MADEDGIYGGEDNDRFEAEEFDQDYVDGGIREDVRDSRVLVVNVLPAHSLPFVHFIVGPAGCTR